MRDFGLGFDQEANLRFSFAGVLILSAMANRFRIHKLSKVDQFVMSYGGMQSCPLKTTPKFAQQPHFPSLHT